MEKEHNDINISEQLQLFQKLHDNRARYAPAFKKRIFRNAINSKSDIYPDSAHFIYELIQNADDVYATEVSIVLMKDKVLFKHNGTKHFTVTDVDYEDEENSVIGDINSITGFLSSKSNNENKIGKFGIGFKSVFQYTEEPIIYDDLFKFKIVDRIIPELLQNDHEFRKQGETLFYIPFRESEYEPSYNDISNKLKTLINATLFLNNLKSISWQDNCSNEKQLFTKTVKNTYNSNNILCETLELDDSKTKSNILMFSRNIQIKNNGKYRICVGYFIDENNNVITNIKPKVYCFFPTSESFNSCFISHAPFLLTENRENIVNGNRYNPNKHNKMLVEQLGVLLADTLIELRNKQLLNSNIFNIIGEGEKREFYNPNEKLIYPEAIYNPCIEKIKNSALLLSRDGKYLTIEDAYKYEAIYLTDLIDKQQLRDLENKTIEVDFLCREINDILKDDKSRFSKDITVNMFNYEVLAKDISSEFMTKQTKEWIYKFYNLIVEKARTYWKPKEKNPIFLYSPIIQLQNNEWTAPFNDNKINVYYDIAGAEGYNIVNSDFIKNDKIKEFLNDIGCKQPDQYDFIIKKILPKYDSDTFIDREILCKDFLTIYEYSQSIKNDNSKYIEFCNIIGNTKIFPIITSAKDRKLSRFIAKEIYLDTDVLLEYFSRKKDDTYNLIEDVERPNSQEKKFGGINWSDYDFNFSQVINSIVFEPVIEKIGIEQFINFIKDIGILLSPKYTEDTSGFSIDKKSYDENISDLLSDWQIEYLKKNNEYPSKCTYADIYEKKIDGLEVLDKFEQYQKSKKLSLQIWKWLIEFNPNSFKDAKVDFFYKKSNIHIIPSKIIETLVENKWLYNSKGEICYPKEITKEELLNSGYSFPDNNLSEIIGIKSQEIDWTAAGATEKDKRAHAIGKKVIDSGLTEEEIVELLRKGKEEKDKKLQKKEQQSINISNNEYASRKESETYDSSIFDDIYIDTKDNDNTYTSSTNSTNKQNQEIENDTQKKLSVFEEQLKKENEKKLETKKIRDSVDNLQKYSKEWFDTLLKLEYGEEAIKEDKTRQAISLSFEKVEKEKDSERVFVLKYPSRDYIPTSIEDIGGLDVTFAFSNEEDFTKSFEVASVKDFTLHLKAKQADLEFLNEKDWTKCTKASIYVDNPVQLMSKLITAFNELNLPENYNLKDNLKDNISFVFGPPATGKSTFLSNKIKTLIDDNTKCKILVLCPTNKACDVLTQKIMDIEEEPTWLGRFVATGSEKVEKEGFVCDRDSDIYLQDKCCLISTIARLPYDGFKHGVGLRDIDWDYIIIDEASMIPLVQIIYAIYKFSPKSKIIVAGDPLQIAPIVREEKWKDENIYKMVKLNSFDNPTTEPIPFEITNLKKQFRSIPAIGKLFSKYAYNDLLEHNRINSEQIPLSLSNINIKPINLIAFKVSRKSGVFRPYKLSNSNIHLYSVLFVTELFKFISNEYIKNNNDRPIKIGIICPYLAEAQMIQKLIEQIPNIPNNIEVSAGTIHGFQGDECDIIFVVLNPSVGLKTSPDKIFLNNKNIINVAISRARDYLFILFPNSKTEGFENLVEIKRLGKIACEDEENVALFTSDEIENNIFGSTSYIEDNSFVTTHQLANVYTQTAKKYEIRIDENSVDIQIDGEI